MNFMHEGGSVSAELRKVLLDLCWMKKLGAATGREYTHMPLCLGASGSSNHLSSSTNGTFFEAIL